MRRFPFTSFPYGWFVVGFSSDIAPGEVKTVHYFGRDIVLFRAMSGGLSAVDKTCPHLGAHLGGGRVVGDCLRCPFHDWAFDARGHCTEVPYAPKIPANARVAVWPLVEQNGVIMVFHGPGEPKGADAEPPWQPPLLEEDGWTANKTIRWELRSHPQEVGENTVDCSHLAPVHHVIKTEVLEVEQKAHRMRVLLHLHATGHVIGMPDEVNDVHLDVTLNGLGMIVSQTHVITGGLFTRQRIHPTPIDEERIAIFAVANTKHMPDPGYTAEIDEIFWQAFVADFARDFPIWENKAYLERPLLAGGDGPIGSYRKWCRQFYAKPEASAALPSAAQAPTVTPPTPLSSLLARYSGAGGALGTVASSVVGLVERVRGAAAPAGHAHATPKKSDEDLDLDLHLADATKRDSRSTHETEAKASDAGRRFPTVEAYFDTLDRRFNPAAAGDLDAVFQWILKDNQGPNPARSGAEGLPSKNESQESRLLRREALSSQEGARVIFAEVRNGTIQTKGGVHTSPTVSIEMLADDYLKMINGELNGALAFSTGRGTLRGPVRLAMRMQRIFPLDA
jgi:nitrite reductase/ring-hydroxylating ferredoxin subunit